MTKADSHVRCIRVYPLALPLRKPFRHATQVRTEADPIIVAVQLANSIIGYGETLPRPYVSGETTATVAHALHNELRHHLLGMRPASFAEALEQIEGLPFVDQEGRLITAARAGLELALLDAYSHYFHKPLSDAVGWFGAAGFGSPGSLAKIRYSGVISGDDLPRLARSIRKMRLFRLRDFKLKVGYPDDVLRIREAARILGRNLGRSLTLRLDANGGWTLTRAIEVLSAVRDIAIAGVEQPLPPDQDQDLPLLKQHTPFPLVHDESLLTLDHAERLHQSGVADGFNIRISKNGGFLPAMRLANFARRNHILCQLGCMVGETSLLSAVGRRFLEHVPGIRFAEGSYGRFLLTRDILRRRVQFGLGGKAKPLPGLGWGVKVEPQFLEQFTRPGMLEFPL